MIDLLGIATMGFYTSGTTVVTEGGLIVFDELELQFEEDATVKVSLDPEEVISVEANTNMNTNIANVSDQKDVSVTVVPTKKISIDTSKTCL